MAELPSRATEQRPPAAGGPTPASTETQRRQGTVAESFWSGVGQVPGWQVPVQPKGRTHGGTVHGAPAFRPLHWNSGLYTLSGSGGRLAHADEEPRSAQATAVAAPIEPREILKQRLELSNG